MGLCLHLPFGSHYGLDFMLFAVSNSDGLSLELCLPMILFFNTAALQICVFNSFNLKTKLAFLRNGLTFCFNHKAGAW